MKILQRTTEPDPRKISRDQSLALFLVSRRTNHGATIFIDRQSTSPSLFCSSLKPIALTRSNILIGDGAADRVELLSAILLDFSWLLEGRSVFDSFRYLFDWPWNQQHAAIKLIIIPWLSFSFFHRG